MKARQISLHIPEAVHRWLRLYAADRGISISDAAGRAIITACGKLAPHFLKPTDKAEIEHYLTAMKEEMPWEEYTRKAVEQALTSAEWDAKRKRVVFPGEDKISPETEVQSIDP